MNGLAGMEKFSHLEDKIYLTIELAKKLREERDRVENELTALRREFAMISGEKDRLEEQSQDLANCALAALTHESFAAPASASHFSIATL